MLKTLTANLLILCFIPHILYTGYLFAPRHPSPTPLICPAEKFVHLPLELHGASFGWGTCIQPPWLLCHKHPLHIKAVALMRA